MFGRDKKQPSDRLRKDKAVFRRVDVFLVFGAVVTFLSAIDVFMLKPSASYGTLAGLLLLLVFFILGGFEFTMASVVHRSELGSWGSAFNAVAVSILGRAFLTYSCFAAASKLPFDPAKVGWFNILTRSDLTLFWILNLVALGLELVVLFLLFRHRSAFESTTEEKAAAMRKISAVAVKTVSECPVCHELVEKDWVLCPQCGTRLPRLCAKCNAPLSETATECSNCGTVVVVTENVQKSIQALKTIAEQDARPEARSARYARLAEAYLKAGNTDQAIETYRKAIHFTEFRRKQSNFMVKMATILHHSGKEKEAMEMLDAALQLDPEDSAGANAVRDEINKGTAKPI
ncbi:MAG TPA: zinc ribbon domain-containing protein [Methanomassiliicoccales archaeon]|nr:zinc ribbon domain-containing protein [Methanomassiliicoccales archaeon]